MKQLMLCLSGGLALVLAAPLQAAAHEPAPPIVARQTTALARRSASIFNEDFKAGQARQLFAGARFEQHGRAGRGVMRRGGGPAFGQAIPRSSAPFRTRVFIRPFFFSPFAFSGFGLGFAYDPFFWGWGYPFGWGYPYYWGPPYAGYGYPGYGYRARAYERYGSLKLDVKPRAAEVYVDGYYMGQVHDFNGAFHHLDLAGGDHKVEIRADGYQPLDLNFKVMPGRTVNYRGDLRRK